MNDFSRYGYVMDDVPDNEFFSSLASRYIDMDDVNCVIIGEKHTTNFTHKILDCVVTRVRLLRECLHVMMEVSWAAVHIYLENAGYLKVNGKINESSAWISSSYGVGRMGYCWGIRILRLRDTLGEKCRFSLIDDLHETNDGMDRQIRIASHINYNLRWVHKNEYVVIILGEKHLHGFGNFGALKVAEAAGFKVKKYFRVFENGDHESVIFGTVAANGAL